MTEAHETPKRQRQRLRRRPAATYSGTSVSFLEKAALRGDGPPMIRISKRLILYDTDDIDAWLESRRVASTSEPPT